MRAAWLGFGTTYTSAYSFTVSRRTWPESVKNLPIHPFISSVRERYSNHQCKDTLFQRHFSHLLILEGTQTRHWFENAPPAEGYLALSKQGGKGRGINGVDDCLLLSFQR